MIEQKVSPLLARRHRFARFAFLALLLVCSCGDDSSAPSVRRQSSPAQPPDSSPQEDPQTSSNGSVHRELEIGSPEKAKEKLLKEPELAHATDSYQRTPLHIAARYGHTEIVRLLVDQGADVNAVAINGFTPLHVCANNAQIAELLLAAGAEPSIKDNFGSTVLQSAATYRKRELVDALLKHGVTLDFRSAIELGEIETVEAFLKKRKELANAVVIDNYATKGRALHLAAHAGQRDAAELLIRYGAEVNARVRWSGMDSVTPLDLAQLHSGVDKVLLDHGADPKDPGPGGHDAFVRHMKAMQAGGVELDIFGVVAIGDDQRVAEMLKADSGLASARSPTGYPVLHTAVDMGHQHIVKVLLESGVDPDIRSEAGARGVERTALHGAAFWDRPEIATALIESGADVNAVTRRGTTPLHESARWGTVAVARILLAAGARVDAKDKDGETPLDEVGDSGKHEEMRKLLEEKGGRR